MLKNSTGLQTSRSARCICLLTALIFSTSAMSCSLEKLRFAINTDHQGPELHFVDASQVHIFNSHNKPIIKANWYCKEDLVVIQHPSGDHQFYYSAAMSQRQMGRATAVPALISFCDGESCPLNKEIFWQRNFSRLSDNSSNNNNNNNNNNSTSPKSSQAPNRLTAR